MGDNHQQLALRGRVAKLQGHLGRLQAALNNPDPSQEHRLALSYFGMGLNWIDLGARIVKGEVGTVGGLYLSRLERAIKNGRLDSYYSRSQLDHALATIERARNGDATAMNGIVVWLGRGHVMRAAEAERE